MKMKKVNRKIMRMLGMLLIIEAGVFLFAGVGVVSAAEYYVPTSTSIVDGDTFCGGSACTSADKIIITFSTSWIFDTFEIHHKYIHDVNYAGMYLGQNEPWNLDNPYIANFLVHDNIIDNSGCYGITLKGVHEEHVKFLVEIF